MTLPVSHFEISGINSKFSQLKNNRLISVTLSVFQFEISGRNFKDEHS